MFNNISAFSGLGKPSIRLEFESNEDLLEFQRKMNAGTPEPEPEPDDDPDGDGETFQRGGGDRYLIHKKLDGLGAPGDQYIVRDLRTRARKEPGNVAANKNLNFEKQVDKTIKNFNKDFYLLLKQNNDSLENDSLENYPETVLFKNKIYEKKNIGYDGGDFGQIFFDVFFPKLKPAKDILKGYTEHEEVNVPIKECINLIPRSKYYFITYISQEFLKKIFVDFIKNNYNKLLKRRESYVEGGYNTSEIDKEIKYYSLYYSNPQAFSALYMNDRGAVGRAAHEAKKYIDGENFSLGKPANDYLYNNIAILDYNGYKPTYQILDSYDSFFKESDKKTSFAGFGIDDTKKLIEKICTENYLDCWDIAKHLKANTLPQSCFNLWHWLHNNIKYEYDTDGLEEVRTPRRVWADRHRGVDCDCLSVFAWCVLRCMGYDPAFELVAFKNKKNFSHIFVNCNGVLVDRVWFIFNEEPPGVTNREIFKIKEVFNLGKLF